MATISKSFSTNVAPDKAWAVVGDLEGVAKWSPAIAKTKVDGEQRFCEMSDGGTLVEKIISRDDAQRFYEYTITESPFPISAHKASFRVEADGAGSRVTWTTSIEPDELAAEIEPMFEESMKALKEFVESA